MRRGFLLLNLLLFFGFGAAMAGEPHPWEPASPVLGQLDIEQFPKVLPAWEEAVLRYQPQAEVVFSLKKAAPARIEVVFGSWCGDSFDHLPPLISALRQAANPGLDLILIGVGRGKVDPAGIIPKRAIERYPTVVIFRGEQEIGRVVETPATTMDADVAKILTQPAGK